MQKLTDPDEKVRLAAVAAAGTLCETTELISQHLLLGVAERCRDKKLSIRVASINVLADKFKRVAAIRFLQCLSSDSSEASIVDIDHFMWVPGSILELLYLGDAQITLEVERVMQEVIFSSKMDSFARSASNIAILASCTDRQYNGYLSILQKKSHTLKDFGIFLEICQLYNVLSK